MTESTEWCYFDGTHVILKLEEIEFQTLGQALLTRRDFCLKEGRDNPHSEYWRKEQFRVELVLKRMRIPY